MIHQLTTTAVVRVKSKRPAEWDHCENDFMNIYRLTVYCTGCYMGM